MRTSSFHPADSASRHGRLMRACCESLESRRLLAVTTIGDQFGSVNGRNLVLQQTDVDGDIIRYSLTGGGIGTLTGTTLDLAGTTPRSSLVVSVRRAGGGNGETTITGITADGSMKSINLRTSLVEGDIVINGAATNGSSLGTLTVRQDTGNITAAGAIGKITAGSFNGAITGTTIGSVTTKGAAGRNGATTTDGSAAGAIHATGVPAQSGRPAIGTVRIGGSAADLTIVTDQGNLTDVTITGDAAGTQILSAGTARNIRVGGVFSNSRIQTQGNTTSVTLGAMTDSNVLVGFAPAFVDVAPVSSADFANGASTIARLNNFTVGRSQRGTAVAQVVGANNLSAAQLGNVRVFNMESTDPPSLHMFALTDPASVRNIDNANPANNFNWRRGQAKPALLDAMLTVVPA